MVKKSSYISSFKVFLPIATTLPRLEHFNVRTRQRGYSAVLCGRARKLRKGIWNVATKECPFWRSKVIYFFLQSFSADCDYSTETRALESPYPATGIQCSLVRANGPESYEKGIWNAATIVKNALFLQSFSADCDYSTKTRALESPYPATGDTVQSCADGPESCEKEFGMKRLKNSPISSFKLYFLLQSFSADCDYSTKTRALESPYPATGIQCSLVRTDPKVVKRNLEWSD